MSRPSTRIAAVVAAYNADRTIVQAVDSLLSGTMPCHIVVVDDCSAVPASQVLARFGDRVEIIRLDRNRGPAAARNVALAEILERGFEYVAIQDADDISYPTRLQKQVEFLDSHPQVGVVSVNLRYIEEHTGAPVMFFMRPPDDRSIRNNMFFNIGVSHAGAVIRAEALRRVGLYSLDYPVAEDYELVRRIAVHYELANLPDVLLDYRVSSQGMSLGRRRRQIYDRIRIQIKYFEPLQWRAWAGVAKAFITFFLPPLLVAAYKKWLMRGRYPACDR